MKLYFDCDVDKMDWKNSIICQNSSQENLQCPANSKRKEIGTGYVSFARLLDFWSQGGTL